jgi:transcriptional regulator with XRE-family HTH domain
MNVADAPSEGTPFGRAVRTRREDLGLSQAKAARIANVSVARWRQIEQGYEKRGPIRIPANPSRDTVKKFATALKWSKNQALILAGFEPDDDNLPVEASQLTEHDQDLVDRITKLPPRYHQAVRAVIDAFGDDTDTRALAS